MTSSRCTKCRRVRITFLHASSAFIVLEIYQEHCHVTAIHSCAQVSFSKSLEAGMLARSKKQEAIEIITLHCLLVEYQYSLLFLQ